MRHTGGGGHAGAGPSGPEAGPLDEDPQARMEREEFQRGHVPEGAPPVEPRPAATIVVTRRASSGFKVLLLRRPTTSRFAAGAYVFPGGVVDEGDAEDDWAGRLPIAEEPAACVAALRELFEETGMLPVPGGRDVPRETLEQARRDLLDGTRSFLDMATELRLDFSRAHVTYFARWITPRRLSRRYDARFFLLTLPEGPAQVTLTEEHDAWLWERPDLALDRSRVGELPMLFPTRKTLEQLRDFDSLESAFASFDAVAVEPMLVKLDMSGKHIRSLMPGDSGYEETY